MKWLVQISKLPVRVWENDLEFEGNNTLEGNYLCTPTNKNTTQACTETHK